MKATATVITKTGIFDNIDKLYSTSTGSTQPSGASTTSGGGEELGGGMTPPPPTTGEELPPSGEPPLEGSEPTIPENKLDNLNILVENNLIDGNKFIDLGMAQQSLGEISKELDKLLNS